ncbi:DUF2062 domain-containing protein [Hyphomicrobium sp.]|jgi:uncharacterized protein (DUF2062 family)|uniref:DUF2062 domain-containing protein n=1 Tax=Hyphomicrobium sp. TaxID=82 RepID=UPI000F95FD26|nr:DUF2062 domain-containing protein [Hyphomicrobium sp.]RUP00692.1 MAG: DUF2062 domain-containing protein [Hyphomicrobium sp.]
MVRHESLEARALAADRKKPLNENRSALQTAINYSHLEFARLHLRLRYLWRRVLLVRATPHEVALGFAIGVFTACTPFLGVQTITACILAFMLRVSMPAALLGTLIGNPVSWPAIWSASYVSGALLLGLDPTYAADHLSETANALGATLAAPSPETLDTAVTNLSPIIEPMMVGGLLVGLIAAVFSYYPTRRAVRVFQRHRKLS